MLRHLTISDLKPGLVYEIPNFKTWLVVSVYSIRVHDNGLKYLDFQELVIDGEELGEVSNATFTFVNDIMLGSMYSILAPGR